MTDTILSDKPAAAPKIDPETLVLRARPAPAIRFKRGLVVGLAAVAIIALVVTAWFALKPRSLHLVGEQSDLAEPAKAPGDALSGLPASYGDAPKLGPPLPGDLGRPILKHQQAIAEGVPSQPHAADQAARTAQEQAAAKRKAARESGVLVQTGARAVTAEAAPTAVATAPSDTDASRLALDPERDPNAQQRKADFVSASDRGGDVNPHLIRPAASPYMLSAGSVIAATIGTG
jgi:type IV secretion system protein VirB10